MTLRVDNPGSTGVSVELTDVVKDYGAVRAVTDLSLYVGPGRFLTLLGPSGSGKTTILQMIAGFIAPTRGSIRIDGQPTDDIPPHRRNLGVVFQGYALFPHLTVFQNVAFPLEMRKVRRDDIARLVSDALDLVGLSGLEARRPRQLSGGQQQRVALARCLVYRPSVLLMDEPLGALDKNLLQQMLVEIKRLQSDLGLTVIYVTHDQTEALTMSDDIAVIEGGEIAQIGSPRDLYDHPSSPFVATFLGEANLFPGAVSDIDVVAGSAIATGPAGLTARGLATPSTEVGATVTLVVRPEDMSLGRGGEAGFAAVVEAVAFVGDAFRIQLVDVAGVPILAKLPKSTVEVPSVGSNVVLAWEGSKATFVAGGRVG